MPRAGCLGKGRTHRIGRLGSAAACRMERPALSLRSSPTAQGTKLLQRRNLPTRGLLPGIKHRLGAVEVLGQAVEDGASVVLHDKANVAME